MIGDFKFYEVGGKIRDELLGLTNKDVDYVAVPTDELFKHGYTAEQMFTILLDYLHSKKFEVFLVTEDCYTIRAKFPEGYKYQGVADFVMARKDPDTGKIIDYFDGKRDLAHMCLRTPLDTETTLNDDPLRILRAIRFKITKGFLFDSDLDACIMYYPYEEKMKVISEERFREELVKCFKHSTYKTLQVLEIYNSLRDYIFKHTNLWLKPTSEK